MIIMERYLRRHASWGVPILITCGGWSQVMVGT